MPKDRRVPVTSNNDFIMAEYQQEYYRLEEENNRSATVEPMLSVLHNVQSVNNKLTELSTQLVVLNGTLAQGGLFKVMKTEQHKLVTLAERFTYDHGGSYINVTKHIFNKQLNCFQGICTEKDFEVLANELLEFKYIVVCTYYYYYYYYIGHLIVIWRYLKKNWR
jgi:hypothetical protein